MYFSIKIKENQYKIQKNHNFLIITFITFILIILIIIYQIIKINDLIIVTFHKAMNPSKFIGLTMKK